MAERNECSIASSNEPQSSLLARSGGAEAVQRSRNLHTTIPSLQNESEYDVFPDKYSFNNNTQVKDLLHDTVSVSQSQASKSVTVSLPKTADGLGFTIDEETVPWGLKVAAITPGGTAHRDGRLQVGDMLMSINGNSLWAWSHSRVLDLLAKLPLSSNVIIEVKQGFSALGESRDRKPSLASEVTETQQHSGKLKLGILKGEAGFGFMLGESKKGPVVKQIVDRSRCAQLQEGDVLLRVNEEIVKKSPHLDLVDTLKRCPTGDKAVFLIHRQAKNTSTRDAAKDCRFVSIQVRLTTMNSTFGFSIFERGSQAVTIIEINESGAADLDGRLTVGDEITHINTHSLGRTSRGRATSLIKKSASQGEMLLSVRRLIPKGPRDVVIDKPTTKSASFGFALQSRSRHRGCKIVRLTPGSPAAKCKQLYVNDQVLVINGKDVSEMKHEEIISLVKTSGTKIRLTVQHPDEEPSKLNKPSEDRKQSLTNIDESLPVLTDTTSISDGDKEIHHIDLQRYKGSFGFSIRGGVDYKSPMSVLKIVEGGAAEKDGRLKRGDELLEINGKGTVKMRHNDTVSIIRNGGDQVRLAVRRDVQHEADKRDHMKLCNEAMKAGYVTVRITNVLLFGMAGAGKTSTKHLIFGLPPPKKRTSTPLAESAERILIRKIRDISGIKAQVTDGNWKPVTVEDLKQLVVDIIQYYSQNTAKLKEVSEELAQKLKQLPLTDSQEPQLQETHGEPPEAENCIESREITSVVSEVNVAQLGSTDTFLKHVSTLITEIQSMVALEQNCLRAEIFGSNWIYFIDSGGQPHFHNLLPLFVQGISAALYVLRLSDRLDDYPLVEYFKDGRPIGDPFRSHLTIEDNFKYLVQSIQSRNEDCRLVCIGTHLDKMEESSESEAEKNTRLLQVLPESICEKCHFNDVCREELILAVNCLSLGPDRTKAADKIRKVIMNCPYREIKVPVWWYNFEIIIEKICNEESCSVMSLGQCRTVAQMLNFHEDALIEALKFFHKHHIFHYYSEVLPGVVFCDTQVLLDKVTELVEHAAFLRDGSKKAPGLGSKLQFRDRGLVTIEFLAEFEKHYTNGLFGPTELIEIFKYLLIATPFNSSSDRVEFFMPSLLGISPATDMTALVTQLIANDSTPLIIQFKNRWPRCGVFCCLQVFLMKECGWSLGKLSNKNKPKQNVAKMYLPNDPGLVTLIDSITYIEVYVESTTSNMVCSKIRDNILSGIKSACKALHYENEEPQLAFLCPHVSSGTVSSSISDISPRIEIVSADQSQPQHVHHPALVLADCGWMRCTQCEDKCYRLQGKHKAWLQGADQQSAVGSSHGQETEVDYSLEDLSKAYTTMVKCGLSLMSAMSRDPQFLAAALFSDGLISQATLEKTLELNETKSDKGRRLYNVVLDVVKVFPDRFVDFVRILRRKASLYSNILVELDRMFIVDTNL